MHLIGKTFFATAVFGAAFASADPPPQPIETSEMKALGPWSVGANNRQDALPSSVWRNSDAVVLGQLFDRLQASPSSPAAGQLARRVLLASGEAPPGPASAESARKRFAALGRLPAPDEIVSMIPPGGGAAIDPNIAQFAMQAELARGKPGEACGRAQELTADPTPSFVLRLRAFCFAAAEQQAATDLNIDIARSAGVSDPWLFAVLGKMVGASAGSTPAKYDTSLDAAASLAANLSLSGKALTAELADASGLALSVLARTEDSPPALRAEAAARLLRVGAIPPEAARAAFRAAGAEKPAPPTKKQATKSKNKKKSKAAAAPPPPPPPPPFVAAVVAVEQQPDAAARGAAVAEWLHKMKTYPDFVATARLFQPEIDALTPNALESLIFARATLALGQIERARSWRAAAFTAPPALDAALDIAVGGGSDGADYFTANRHDAAKRVDSKMVADFVGSTQREAIGESALIAAALAADGAWRLDSDTLVTLIQGLRALGLTESARALAVEALIADLSS